MATIISILFLTALYGSCLWMSFTKKGREFDARSDDFIGGGAERFGRRHPLITLAIIIAVFWFVTHAMGYVFLAIVAVSVAISFAGAAIGLIFDKWAPLAVVAGTIAVLVLLIAFGVVVV